LKFYSTVNRIIIEKYIDFENKLKINSSLKVMSGSSRLEQEINDIPLADEDVTEELSDNESHNQNDSKLSERYRFEQSIESIPSVYTNGTDSPTSAQHNCIQFFI
jgi:hypothetical protein